MVEVSYMPLPYLHETARRNQAHPTPRNIQDTLFKQQNSQCKETNSGLKQTSFVSLSGPRKYDASIQFHTQVGEWAVVGIQEAKLPSPAKTSKSK